MDFPYLHMGKHKITMMIIDIQMMDCPHIEGIFFTGVYVINKYKETQEYDRHFIFGVGC